MRVSASVHVHSFFARVSCALAFCASVWPHCLHVTADERVKVSACMRVRVNASVHVYSFFARVSGHIVHMGELREWVHE